MYSEEQYRTTLGLYDKCGSVTKVITQLGYPVRRQTLYNWIARRKHLPSGHSTFRGTNTAEHPRHPALGVKLDAIRRCFELGENVQFVSDEIGYISVEKKVHSERECRANGATKGKKARPTQ